MKCGTKIEIQGWDADGSEVWRPAKITRRTRVMATLDELPGYYPVKFSDGAVLMVHEERFRVA